MQREALPHRKYPVIMPRSRFASFTLFEVLFSCDALMAQEHLHIGQVGSPLVEKERGSRYDAGGARK